MKCEKCGRETEVRYFLPGIATVTHDIHDGLWVCQKCLPTPKEKLLQILRSYNRQQPAKKKPETISLQEFQEAKRKAKFKCSLGIENIEDCEGYLCPTRLKPKCTYNKCSFTENCAGTTAGCYEDYYDECQEAFQAQVVLKKLLTGKIEVKGFSIQLR